MLKELYDKIQHEEAVQNDYEDDFEDGDDIYANEMTRKF